jgi:intracellular sulfur oxidation DsrE/DsrF family protein
VNAGGADYRQLVEQHGASFFVCNNALSGIAGVIAKKLTEPGKAVTRDQVVAIHDDLATHFLPGALLVPAGVAAINAAQEAKFTLLVA